MLLLSIICALLGVAVIYLAMVVFSMYLDMEHFRGEIGTLDVCQDLQSDRLDVFSARIDVVSQRVDLKQ